MVRRDTLANGKQPEAEAWPRRKESEILKFFPASTYTSLNRPGEQNFPRATEWNSLIMEGPPGSGPPHLVGRLREEAETPSRSVGPWASGMAVKGRGVGRFQQSEKASRVSQVHRRN